MAADLASAALELAALLALLSALRLGGARDDDAPAAAPAPVAPLTSVDSTVDASTADLLAAALEDAEVDAAVRAPLR